MHEISVVVSHYDRVVFSNAGVSFWLDVLLLSRVNQNMVKFCRLYAQCLFRGKSVNIA